mmetsp:Transcript_11499/g.16525  ORF Transcript_11499/g.16525 Transcript_11499/m.16525 type:complete len:86 (+) Transcript_11499:482-739(+)
MQPFECGFSRQMFITVVKRRIKKRTGEKNKIKNIVALVTLKIIWHALLKEALQPRVTASRIEQRALQQSIVDATGRARRKIEAII